MEDNLKIIDLNFTFLKNIRFVFLQQVLKYHKKIQDLKNIFHLLFFLIL